MTLEQLRDTDLSPPQDTLLSYLRGCATVAEVNARPNGWAFLSAYHLLDAHGEFFTAAARPIEVLKLPDRLCYGNAASTAATYATDGLMYAEGFATVTAGAQLLPLPHGWCVTPDGVVVDPTWDLHPDTTYFGITFPDPAMWPYDGGGLLTDPDRLLPLLRDGLTLSAPSRRDPWP
ncbi:hypothetical protein GCM10010172_30280 [Paractinoplanes ferrugineus]|uniref:Uncharacterized protein n=1 Tax=Paractinoplanes ferrugineus TaxID=113564 RepID=A0A919MJ26_9ACTN|nr:hypothetical protein [Actinoplanes ferrugineus]GIE14280.1 hypothetical protein Afe05nite_61200 [Actinoplanes ferrugineus]